ncbi:hypothetical protein M0R72_13680 [Candidatus Pacearchaeota archaeon]|jgi:hypothetical protein|nr:hypothetical protein [Candidatus Pacearchaeota archaeon]
MPKNGGQVYSRWTGGSLIFYPGERGYGNEWFVDSVNGATTNDGKTWEGALKTIAAAVALASAGDTVYIRGSFTEAVVVSLAGLRIIGCGSRPKESQWTAAADAKALTISANYVEVANIYFSPPAYSAGTPAAIQLGNANYAFIHHCRFQGKTASHNAIYSPVCNSDNVEISDCDFHYMNTATHGAAILGVEAGGLSYSGWRILRNTFFSCVTAVNINGRVCRVEGNTFMEYGIAAAGTLGAVCTKGLDLSGTSSGANVVCGNIMQGDYDSDSGLYTAGASGDCWMGNFASDVAETEVDTTTGLTIAVPAV